MRHVMIGARPGGSGWFIECSCGWSGVIERLAARWRVAADRLYGWGVRK